MAKKTFEDQMIKLLSLTSIIKSDDSPCDYDLEIENIFMPLFEKEVPKWGGSTTKHKFLHLPLVFKNKKAIKMRPILQYKKASENDPVDRFFLYCVFLHDSRIWAYVFRFEGPEQCGNEFSQGSHCYYHCQLVFNERKESANCSNAFRFLCSPCYEQENDSKDEVPFFPDHVPAFPIIANSTVELLISLFISLYGWRDFEKRWILGSGDRGLFDSYVKSFGMCFNSKKILIK